MAEQSSKKALTEEEVAQTMKRWQEAFEAGRDDFFDFFDPAVSLFTVSSPTRVDSLEVYRRGFEQFFLGEKRKSQILSPEVRLLGDGGAVMTFHNRILINGISSNIRGTVVFARNAKGELKCVHMHNSPLGQPSLQGRIEGGVEDVTVLEERVAAGAAMVGTPK
jgi:ketosteroid isomerase-like protein